LAGILNNNPKVISLAVTLLFFAAFFQIADGLAMGGIGALRGYKDTFGPMKIMALSYWGIGLPVGIILSTTNLIVEPMQAVGMWIGICLGLLVAATLMVLRVKETSNRFINEQQS
jgi:MATE family multidrug resistance protein